MTESPGCQEPIVEAGATEPCGRPDVARRLTTDSADTYLVCADHATGPLRYQQKRTRGWRKPPGAVSVARPSRWGNPYTLHMMRNQIKAVAALSLPGDTEILDPRALAAEAFAEDMRFGPDSRWWWYGPHMQILEIGTHLGELAGRDLMCWCPLDTPCHGDVLLVHANASSSRQSP